MVPLARHGREEGRKGLKADLVGDDWNITRLGNLAYYRFGIHDAIENNYSARVGLIQEGRKFLGDTVSRKDVCSQQKAGGLIVDEVMAAQDPAEGWQHDLAVCPALVFESA